MAAVGVLLITATAPASVWHVKKEHPGHGAGVCWAAPLATIQEGIDAAFGAGGGAIGNWGASAYVVNTIVWGNAPEGFYNDATSAVDLSYSCVQDIGFTGPGVLYSNPLFRNPSSDDFRLGYGSPCIDTGVLAGAPTSDYSGVPRPQGSGVNIGAHEYGGGGEGEGERELEGDLDCCEDGCLDAPDSPDNDGDGVSACVEDCLGTSDNLIDKDGDGIPGNFEARHGLDPLYDDADEDSDGDGLSNLREFPENSDPQNPNSPHPTRFVALSPLGSDAGGDGSRSSPWAGIGHAPAQLGTISFTTARIVLLAGEYHEELELTKGITLSGTLKREQHTSQSVNNVGMGLKQHNDRAFD